MSLKRLETRNFNPVPFVPRAMIRNNNLAAILPFRSQPGLLPRPSSQGAVSAPWPTIKSVNYFLAYMEHAKIPIRAASLPLFWRSNYLPIVNAGSNFPATVGHCALFVVLRTCSDRYGISSPSVTLRSLL